MEDAAVYVPITKSTYLCISHGTKRDDKASGKSLRPARGRMESPINREHQLDDHFAIIIPYVQDDLIVVD